MFCFLKNNDRWKLHLDNKNWNVSLKFWSVELFWISTNSIIWSKILIVRAHEVFFSSQHFSCTLQFKTTLTFSHQLSKQNRMFHIFGSNTTESKTRFLIMACAATSWWQTIVKRWKTILKHELKIWLGCTFQVEFCCRLIFVQLNLTFWMNEY